MSERAFRRIGTPVRRGIVSVCDHASNAVPDGIELGVSTAMLQKHIAWDIGAAGVVERMARTNHIAAHMGKYSRLVVDLHREEDARGLIPQSSDGHVIAGNIGADEETRVKKHYKPYHDALAKWLDAADPKLILSIHSFTPTLESDPQQERPWDIGLLYNNDDRAAQHAIRLFADLGCTVGDNEPYSGKQFNATMNRHAEAQGRPYCAIEIRNDLITQKAGQARWAAIIADVAERVVLALD